MFQQKFKQFQDYAFDKAQIPQELTGLSWDFIEYEFRTWCMDRKELKGNIYPKFDFGKHEYGDLVTVEQGLHDIQLSLVMSIIDYDRDGKNITQKRLQQFIKSKGHKHWHYKVCKTFYLWLGDHHGDTVDHKYGRIKDVDHCNNWFNWQFKNGWDSIWNKHQQLEKQRFLRKLAS